jgi:hypothetical protein
MGRIFRRGGGVVGEDTGFGEFATQAGQVALGQPLDHEGELREALALVQEREDVGELSNVFVGEVLLDDGLVPLAGDEHRPKAFDGGIGETQRDGAVESGAGNARTKFGQSMVGEREIGEPGVPQQCGTEFQKLVEFHGGGFRLSHGGRGRLRAARLRTLVGGRGAEFARLVRVG